MKYLCLSLLLTLAFFSCEKDAADFQPREADPFTPEQLVLSEHPGYLALLAYLQENLDPKTRQPVVTVTEMAGQLDLQDLTEDINRFLERRPVGVSIESHIINGVILPVKTKVDKATGPCYDEYKKATRDNLIELAGCMATAEGYEGMGLCALESGISAIEADVEYNQCLSATYPDADLP